TKWAASEITLNSEEAIRSCALVHLLDRATAGTESLDRRIQNRLPDLFHLGVQALLTRLREPAVDKGVGQGMHAVLTNCLDARVPQDPARVRPAGS
ncbi:MAG: hypothetical protein NTU91_03190, partial [Chloroflexi bacterium]|nr:hypothetical protein [Chloroflexota bacterium]